MSVEGVRSDSESSNASASYFASAAKRVLENLAEGEETRIGEYVFSRAGTRRTRWSTADWYQSGIYEWDTLRIASPKWGVIEVFVCRDGNKTHGKEVYLNLSNWGNAILSDGLHWFPSKKPYSPLSVYPDAITLDGVSAGTEKAGSLARCIALAEQMKAWLKEKDESRRANKTSGHSDELAQREAEAIRALLDF